MKELNIDEVKKIELELLKTFDKFCKENDLCYSLAFGTLIGAVRHKGFIPWDDDIDVIMPRVDYEKFMKLFKDDSCTLVNHHITDNYFYPFAKLVANNTLLIEPTVRKKFNKGIYIDIFPADGVPNESEKCVHIYDEIYEIKNKLGRCIIGYKKANSFSRTIGKYAVVALHTFTNYKKYTQQIEDIALRIPYGDTLYYGNIVWPDTVKNIGKVDFFNNLIDMEFEGETFKGFADYDKVLSAIYGNYMEFPPVEERFLKHKFTAYQLDKDEQKNG